MEEKEIICAASHYKKKYFFEPKFASLPAGVRVELIELCKRGAAEIEGFFAVCFGEGGRVFFVADADDNDFDFDEIGAELVIKQYALENEGLVKSIQLWYSLYCTESGRKIKEQLTKKLGSEGNAFNR